MNSAVAQPQPLQAHSDANNRRRTNGQRSPFSHLNLKAMRSERLDLQPRQGRRRLVPDDQMCIHRHVQGCSQQLIEVALPMHRNRVSKSQTERDRAKINADQSGSDACAEPQKRK